MHQPNTIRISKTNSVSHVFINNVPKTCLFSSYHLMWLFKYCKTMSFQKIRNTDHCANHREKHPKLPVFYIFSRFFWRFLIKKTGMIHFSGFSRSIEFFKCYKTMSFQKVTSVGNLILTKVKHRRTMIFLPVLLIPLRRTIPDLYVRL